MRAVQNKGFIKAIDPTCMVNAWFDNFYLQVYTPNGCRENHSMAIQFTQTAQGIYNCLQDSCILCLLNG